MDNAASILNDARPALDSTSEHRFLHLHITLNSLLSTIQHHHNVQASLRAQPRRQRCVLDNDHSFQRTDTQPQPSSRQTRHPTTTTLTMGAATMMTATPRAPTMRRTRAAKRRACQQRSVVRVACMARSVNMPSG